MATTVGSHIPERRHMAERRTTARTAGHLNAADWIAMTLLFVGGINWGLVGLFDIDLVATLSGTMSTLSRLVYALVGASALYTIYSSSKLSRS